MGTEDHNQHDRPQAGENTPPTPLPKDYGELLARECEITWERARVGGDDISHLIDRHAWTAAREGGPLGLAPRASVAAELLVLASLAAALERETGFTKADYHLRHPAGKLGEASRK